MMDQFLAGLYGTNKTAGAQAQSGPSEEDIAKQAHADLFIEAATQYGINLQGLPQEKIAELYSTWTENMAAAQGGGDVASLEAQARFEYEKNAAAQTEYIQKFAEAEYAGKVMAHSYVAELNKIAEGKEAAVTPGHFERLGKKVHHASIFKGRQGSVINPKGAVDHLHEHPLSSGKAKAIGAGVYGAGAAAAGGAAAGAHHAFKHKEEEHKEAGITALDRVAADYAFAMLDEYNKTAGTQGYDLATAEQKLAAVLVLGPPPSEKTANAQNFEETKHLRALELLEMAGYPVNWS